MRESAIPPVVGEAILARAEIGWGASCRQTPLMTRVVVDVIYRIVDSTVLYAIQIKISARARIASPTTGGIALSRIVLDPSGAR